MEEFDEVFMLNIEMALLTKTPINIGIGMIHSLTLKEISELSFGMYNSYVSLLTSNIYDLKKLVSSTVATNEFGWLIEQLNKKNENSNHILSAFAVFFNEKISFSENKIFVGEIVDKRIITKEMFEIIQYILKKMNFITIEEPLKFKDKRAEQMWKQIQKDNKLKEEMVNNKDTLNILPSIMSGVAWKTNIGINVVSEMSIYQLYDAFYRLNIVDNYFFTMEGLYHGTIDSKEVNKKIYNWSQVIDINK